MAVQLSPPAAVDALERTVRIPAPPGGAAIGYQLYDPESGRFIAEGDWIPRSRIQDGTITISLPPVPGPYHVFVSPVDERTGWAWQAGARFTLINCTVAADRTLSVQSVETTDKRALRFRRLRARLRQALVSPWITTWQNRALIRSMVRRDITARYRGSFADRFWAVLNPLLLMVTYWFVFGVVLRTRFGPDGSRNGFVLYFLCGMLPWLAFSEAVGRSPHVILEHRTYVKKLVFPLQILPVNLVISGLITQAIALGFFLLFLLASRGGLPASALWLPLYVVPQVLLTLGLAWGISAVTVYLRDIAQVMGFVLTLWFFITPICYPETALPEYALPVLGKNPMFTLVHGFRCVLLEGTQPEWHSLWKLWLLAAFVLFGGYALFHKLRGSFADVI